MVDVTGKVRKHAAGTLEPGEQVIESAIVQPRGSTARQMAGGVGGLVGVGIAAAVQRGKGSGPAAPQGSWADQFPKDKVFLSVTDRRLVVHKFAVMSGRPSDLLGWIPPDAVANLEVQRGKLNHSGVLSFTDGSAYEMDILRGGGDPDRLVRAMGRGTVT